MRRLAPIPLILLGLLALAACGKKPSVLQAPEGADSGYPHVYPKPDTPPDSSQSQ